MQGGSGPRSFRIRNAISDPEERLLSKAGLEYDSDNRMLKPVTGTPNPGCRNVRAERVRLIKHPGNEQDCTPDDMYFWRKQVCSQPGASQCLED
jgi:hypothetical protein